MSASPQQMLDAVNDAIMKRLSGDGYEGYSSGGQQFTGCSLKDMYDLRDKFQREVNASSGRCFGLAEPFSI